MSGPDTMSNSNRPKLRIDQLVVGSVSKASLVDVTGRKLIARGTTITLALIDDIRRDGVTFLEVVAETAGKVDAPETNASLTQTTKSGAIEQQRLQPYSTERIEQLEAKFNTCQQLVGYMIGALHSGEKVDAREAEHEINDYAEELADDPDPVVAGALAFEPNLTLEKRCVRFSILCMAVGAAQKLNPTEIQDLGMAALMHDWSLFDAPPEARFPRSDMTEEERYHFSKHPLASESLLRKIRGTTEVQRIVVAQVHELLDGSGYPHGISGRRVHPLSRIASVAEGFLALTSPPPGAARVIPCDAIAYLIAAASKGQYSPASVSALLEATTLFPLGSILELSDTTQVRVIRANPGKYGYPIVQVVSKPDVVIDLSQSELFITRPVASTTYDEIRLPDAYKELNSKSG